MFGERGDTQETESGGEGRPRRRSRARAWMRGLAMAALVLVVLVAAAVFWVLESARKGQLSERLLKLSNQVLSNSSNLRFYADHIRVNGGTVELQSLHVDAREKGKWYRVLDARSGRFSSDLEALIFKRPQVFDLSLSGPVLHIVTADDSAIVLPSFASRGKGGGGGMQDGLVLTLDNLQVRSHARGDSTQWWEDGALVARVRPEGRGYVIGLDHAKGRCPPVGIVLRSASGKATAVADTVRLQSLVA